MSPDKAMSGFSFCVCFRFCFFPYGCEVNSPDYAMSGLVFVLFLCILVSVGFFVFFPHMGERPCLHIKSCPGSVFVCILVSFFFRIGERPCIKLRVSVFRPS